MKGIKVNFQTGLVVRQVNAVNSPRHFRTSPINVVKTQRYSCTLIPIIWTCFVNVNLFLYLQLILKNLNIISYSLLCDLWMDINGVWCPDPRMISSNLYDVVLAMLPEMWLSDVRLSSGLMFTNTWDSQISLRCSISSVTHGFQQNLNS